MKKALGVLATVALVGAAAVTAPAPAEARHFGVGPGLAFGLAAGAIAAGAYGAYGPAPPLLSRLVTGKARSDAPGFFICPKKSSGSFSQVGVSAKSRTVAGGIHPTHSTGWRRNTPRARARIFPASP